jgi:diguanylate cyclase (GGDEF)-like protein/PAS domain S-box-containing protein
VENSSELVTIVDPDGTLRYANPAWQRVLGYDLDESVGKMNVLDHVHPDDLGRVIEETEKALAQGGVATNEAEYRFRHANGTWRWMESEGTYLLDDPAVGGVVVNSRDITERKEADERLREAEERYRTLVETVPAMTYIQEIGEGMSVTIYVSPQVEDVVGYTPEECTSTPDLWAKILHPEDKERVLAEDRRTNETGEPFAVEYRQFAKDGAVVWLRDEATLVRDEEGEPQYWLGVQIDITERKRAEEALEKAEERYRSLVEHIPAVTYTDLADGSFEPVYTSPQIEALLGYTPEEWRTQRLWDKRLHPDDRERILAADDRFEEGGEEAFDEEYRLLAKDGRVVWVREEAVLVRDAEGAPLYWQGVIYDLTKRKQTEEALRRSEERYRTVVEEQTELVCRFSSDLVLTFVNPAYCRYFGKEAEELVGISISGLVHEPDLGYYEEELTRLNPQSPTATIEEQVYTPGGLRWLQWSDTALFDEAGRIVEYQSVGRDITERREAEERLEHQALHDALTGLPNRRLFADRLGHALKRTRRQAGGRVAVLFMDLDEFKVVNDSLGHETGDVLLTEVAQRLERCLRPEDTLARFGGDEFVVLVEDVGDPSAAIRVAERITEELREPFVVGGREQYASVSIGVALGTDQTKSAEDLLRDADTAMYQAKRTASGYRLFVPAMYERVVRRLELENDLRRAIDQGQLAVHYQPIFHLGSQEPWGMEALVRWDHPEWGLLNPGEFVALAEQTGLIVPMGTWVLMEACLQTKIWQDSNRRDPPLGVIVNLSVTQLRHPGCEETVRRALESSGLAPQSLSLDVTESAFVDVLEGGVSTLKRLRAMGVKISIDDFGTGYSSLSYLKRLPVDALKIDKSFVGGLGGDTEDTVIVRLVADMAHTLGLEVVAEGVETRTQASLLAEIGCDMAQGYHFAGPYPPEAASKFLGTAIKRPVHSENADSLSDSL